MVDYEESERGELFDQSPGPNQSPGDDPEMASSKSTRTPAFQFYPKEFLSSSKVIAMSATERGIYITLLATQWLDGSLPDDLAALARLNGMKPQQFARIWKNTLERCFTAKNGSLVNERLERERKTQREFREKQRDNAARGWQRRRNAKPLPDTSGSHQSGNALQSASALKNVHTHTENARARGAPIHQTHRSHAACGRICVPGTLHAVFVRARNHDNADNELREWYLAVDNEWSVGARKGENTGGDEFKFWRARFEERWPAATVRAAAVVVAERWECRHVERCANREMCASATILGRPESA